MQIINDIRDCLWSVFDLVRPVLFLFLLCIPAYFFVFFIQITIKTIRQITPQKSWSSLLIDFAKIVFYILLALFFVYIFIMIIYSLPYYLSFHFDV